MILKMRATRHRYKIDAIKILLRTGDRVGNRSRRKSQSPRRHKHTTTPSQLTVAHSEAKRQSRERTGFICFIAGLIITAFGYCLNPILHDKLDRWNKQISEAKQAEDYGSNSYQQRLADLSLKMRLEQDRETPPRNITDPVPLSKINEAMIDLSEMDSDTKAKLDTLSNEIDSLTPRPNKLKDERDKLAKEYDDLHKEVTKQIIDLQGVKVYKWPQHILLLVELMRVVVFDLELIFLEDDVTTAAKVVQSILDQKMMQYEDMRYGCFFAGILLTGVGAWVGFINRRATYK